MIILPDQKIYADLTFIINFVMDFCILWATAKLAGIKIVYKRLIIASIIGGLYAVGYLLPDMSQWYTLPLKIIFSCLLIILALWPKGWEEFKKAFLYFYAINFTVAGATIGISYLFHTNTQAATYSYLWLLGGILCAITIGIAGEKYFVKKVIPNLLRFNVKLKFGDLICNGEGFLDTGNGLRDPITNKPVVVAEYRLIKGCLPDDFINVLEKSNNETDMLEALADTSWASRIRLIPFTSIGKKHGLLVGVRADEILVETGDMDLVHKNVVVGIYKDILCAEGQYQMLIPSEIVQN
ncbi:Sporulation sigma-E factor processing peptidase (SpoIIGA) [Candidatus Syntrophocurvum alkaliphilum]|uniref:Sporulation sigma-E factor-processing peptidase n=1 Tax=Candidatus Syntrophocurvum alkaliphilum TaxID=2293317 RepID=A0A6I6DCQ0_9FIRM|nr:sigma-E processing peptidase SpoIIGA [Candidatus Syntrophocurvum alkaliphilum]QGT99144.1 Sporulation sigma-E factor processing peptidase (SpoIIGA) [Candidatus Syntrophocurvum alkaliphilum]